MPRPHITECEIEECPSTGPFTQAMCPSHYMRFWRCGNPTRPLKIERHGMTKTPEFEAWTEMKFRCYNPNSNRYYRYGARGIKVCDEWLHSFKAFFAYVGSRPSRFHSIDRIDNDSDYKPGNVKWSTRIEQGNNRGNNRLLTYQGETHTMTEWSRITGLKVGTIWNRVARSGWSDEKTLSTPKMLPHYCYPQPKTRPHLRKAQP